MALATQADLEKFLQIDVTNEPDAAVTMLLENATGLIQTYCDRRFELTSYSEVHNPPGTYSLFVDQWPIDETTNAVTVTENGTALTKSDDFLLVEATGEIIRVSASSRRRRWIDGGLQSIAVTYDAGYDMTTDPLILPEAATVKDVCIRVVARAFQAGADYANEPVGGGKLLSLRLDGSDSIQYQARSVVDPWTQPLQLTKTDKELLDQLRRKVLIG